MPTVEAYDLSQQIRPFSKRVEKWADRVRHEYILLLVVFICLNSAQMVISIVITVLGKSVAQESKVVTILGGSNTGIAGLLLLWKRREIWRRRNDFLEVRNVLKFIETEKRKLKSCETARGENKEQLKWRLIMEAYKRSEITSQIIADNRPNSYSRTMMKQTKPLPSDQRCTRCEGSDPGQVIHISQSNEPQEAVTPGTPGNPSEDTSNNRQISTSQCSQRIFNFFVWMSEFLQAAQLVLDVTIIVFSSRHQPHIVQSLGGATVGVAALLEFIVVLEITNGCLSGNRSLYS